MLEYLFLEEGILFDAVYTRVKTFNRSNEYCNYNQIFTDFELIPESDQKQPIQCPQLE